MNQQNPNLIGKCRVARIETGIRNAASRGNQLGIFEQFFKGSLGGFAPFVLLPIPPSLPSPLTSSYRTISHLERGEIIAFPAIRAVHWFTTAESVE